MQFVNIETAEKMLRQISGKCQTANGAIILQEVAAWLRGETVFDELKPLWETADMLVTPHVGMTGECVLNQPAAASSVGPTETLGTAVPDGELARREAACWLILEMVVPRDGRGSPFTNTSCPFRFDSDTPGQRRFGT